MVDDSTRVIAGRGLLYSDEGEGLRDQWSKAGAANEWDYDVSERVTNAVGCIQARDGDMATLMHLRWTLNALMDQVSPTELTAPELVGIIAILAPANGRQLITQALTEALRPVLRLVDNAVDPRKAATHLSE